jgi:hypothetical protein
MNYKRILCPGAVALALSLMATTASATLYSVKIGTSSDGTSESGAAVLGSSTSWWNTFSYISSTPYQVSLVDDTGAASSVLVTINNSGGVGQLTNAAGSPAFLMDTVRYQNPGGTWQIELDGLSANTTYQFVGYSAWINGTTGYGGTWSVAAGTAGTGTYTATGNSVDVSSGVGQAYVEFLVTTNSSGTLVINDTNTSGYVPIEGFQISSVTAVPEPGSLLMMLGGLALLGAYTRRARR